MKLLALLLGLPLLTACGGGNGNEHYYGIWQTTNTQNEVIEVERFAEIYDTDAACSASPNAMLPTPDLATNYRCVRVAAKKVN